MITMTAKINPAEVPQKTLFTGAKMPALGIGTFGSDRVDSDTVSAAVEGAIRSGYRSIDGGACYGNEAEIGKVYKKDQRGIPVNDILTSNVVKNLSQDDVNTVIGNMSDINSSNKFYSGIKQLVLRR